MGRKQARTMCIYIYILFASIWPPGSSSNLTLAMDNCWKGPSYWWWWFSIAVPLQSYQNTINSTVCEVETHHHQLMTLMIPSRSLRDSDTTRKNHQLKARCLSRRQLWYHHHLHKSSEFLGGIFPHINPPANLGYPHDELETPSWVDFPLRKFVEFPEGTVHLWGDPKNVAARPAPIFRVGWITTWHHEGCLKKSDFTSVFWVDITVVKIRTLSTKL